MKKNYSFAATLAITTIASSIVFSSLSAFAAADCNFFKGKNAPPVMNNTSPSSLGSNDKTNPSGNQWGIWGIGAAIAAGLFGAGAALKYKASHRQNDEVMAEVETATPDFPEWNNFAIVVPPEALISTQEVEADLTSVG